MLGTEKPIFIVGCSNSGTKCIFKPLMEHRDVGGLNRELHWLGIQPNLDGRINRLFALYPCFESNFAHAEVRPMAHGSGPLDWQDVEGLIKNFSIIKPGMWKKGKRLVFKDPKLSLRLTWIKRLWPDAIIIAMVRNPWSVVEGIIRRLPVLGDVAMNLDVPTATAQWINTNAVLLLDSQKVSDFMWVRYEDLIKAKTFPVESDKKQIWSKILRHCELEPDKFTIPNKSSFSEYKENRDLESWKKLSPWGRDFISIATRGLLDKLGYEDYPKRVEALDG